MNNSDDCWQDLIDSGDDLEEKTESSTTKNQTRIKSGKRKKRIFPPELQNRLKALKVLQMKQKGIEAKVRKN